MSYDHNKMFGLLKFHSGYGKFYFSSPKGYNRKIIKTHVNIDCTVLFDFSVYIHITEADTLAYNSSHLKQSVDKKCVACVQHVIFIDNLPLLLELNNIFTKL